MREEEAAAAAVAQMTDVKERGRKRKSLTIERIQHSGQIITAFCFLCMSLSSTFRRAFFLSLARARTSGYVFNEAKRERDRQKLMLFPSAQTATYGQKVISKI